MNGDPLLKKDKLYHEINHYRKLYDTSAYISSYKKQAMEQVKLMEVVKTVVKRQQPNHISMNHLSWCPCAREICN